MVLLNLPSKLYQERTQTMNNKHEGVLIAVREAFRRSLRKHRAYFGICKGDKELTETIVPMVDDDLARLDAFLADAPDLKDGLKHLEKFNGIHRHFEEQFEDAAILLHQATKGRDDD